MTMSLEVLLVVLAQCAIAVLIGLGIRWFLGFGETPAEPAKLIMAIVWIVVGIFIIVKLLRLAGIA